MEAHRNRGTGRTLLFFLLLPPSSSSSFCKHWCREGPTLYGAPERDRVDGAKARSKLASPNNRFTDRARWIDKETEHDGMIDREIDRAKYIGTEIARLSVDR